MPLDAQIAPIVDLVNEAAMEAPPLAEQTPEMRREAYLALVVPFGPGPDVPVIDMSCPGPAGAVPLRVYQPVDATGIVVFYHGGGWCIGDLDSHDNVCRQIARQSGTVVVSVGYRLAPEDPFPAAVDDSWAALGWVWDERKALCGEADAAVAVGGDSAGGNLAAVVSLMARDRLLADPSAPDLAAQLLIYPAVDTRRPSPHGSVDENGEGFVLTREGMEWFLDQYRPDDGDWRASPLLAPTLSGLPPALVVTAEFDPLRDEGVAYVDALREAGVEVDHVHYDGMVHIFFQLSPAIDAGADAVARFSQAAATALAR